MSYRLCSQGPLPSLVASIATHSVCNWVRSCPFCLRVHSALFVFSYWQLLSWLDRHGHCESGSKTARKDWEVDHMCSQGRRNWGRLAAPPGKGGQDHLGKQQACLRLPATMCTYDCTVVVITIPVKRHSTACLYQVNFSVRFLCPDRII